MSRQLAKLAGGMLFQFGYVTGPAFLKLLDRYDAPSAHRGARPIADRAPVAPAWRTALDLVIVAAIGGSAFLLLREAAPAFGAAPLIESRLAIGALALSPFAWRARRQLATAGWWKIVAIGAANLLVPFPLFARSSERAPAGVKAIVFSTSVNFRGPHIGRKIGHFRWKPAPPSDATCFLGSGTTGSRRRGFIPILGE